MSTCKWTKCLYDIFADGTATVNIDLGDLATDIATAIDLALGDELTVIIPPPHLIPTPTIPDQRLQVSSSVVSFTALDAVTTNALWRIEGGAVRVTFDGSAPVAGNPASGNGVKLINNDSGVWSKETAEAARFIRNTGQDAWIHLSEFTTP